MPPLMLRTGSLWLSLVLARVAFHDFTAARPLQGRAAPVVKLDNGTFTGTSSITGPSSLFLGIPFAQPPTGDLRFQLPQPNSAYSGTYSASEFGLSCPQMDIDLPLPAGLAANTTDFLVNSIFQAVFPDGEDCLTLNVIKPDTATPTSNLPVVVWIFGGGFEIGSTSMYDGSVIVERSIALGEPVVYVSMNYRLNALGFLASQEVKNAGVGNLGLQDQREALRWVQKYISAFGGDPTKVTIWGESAGAISVALHMLTNDGNPDGLFRGAFMESGSPIPVGDITNGQVYYDDIVSTTGCSGSSDTLQCLREVEYDELMDAINATPGIFAYQSLKLAWLPRSDGVFLTGPPQQLVAGGQVADIPFVNGDCDDEGTLFSFSSLNVTTDAEFQSYVQDTILVGMSNSNYTTLADLYPEDPTKGSPFDTGLLNILTLENKRISAVLGDAVFQGPRRFFLQHQSGKQNIWSFLHKRDKLLPVVGSVHASDILDVYADGEMTDYLINFVNTLNPNADGQGNHLSWPQYTTSSPNLMTFLDGIPALEVTQDNYRLKPLEFITNYLYENPL